MPAQFEFHTKKVLTLFLLPVGVLVAYLAYSVVTARSRVAAIPDDARRQAAMHSLTVLTALSLLLGRSFSGHFFHSSERSEYGIGGVRVV